jgi:hypothetical protein
MRFLRMHRRPLFWATACAGTIATVSASASNVDHVQAPTNATIANPSCWSTGYSALTHTCSGTDSALLNIDNISPGDNDIQAWITVKGSTPGAGYPEVCCQLQTVNDDITLTWYASTQCTGGSSPAGSWQTKSLGSVYQPYTSPGTSLESFGYGYVYCYAVGGMSSDGEIGALHYKD